MSQFRTQEDLMGHVSSVMEANGWKKEWVNLSTAGYVLIHWSKAGTEFTMSLEDMTFAGIILPDVSDILVD